MKNRQSQVTDVTQRTGTITRRARDKHSDWGGMVGLSQKAQRDAGLNSETYVVPFTGVIKLSILITDDIYLNKHLCKVIKCSFLTVSSILHIRSIILSTARPRFANSAMIT